MQAPQDPDRDARPASNRRTFLARTAQAGAVAAPALLLANVAKGQLVEMNARKPRLGTPLPEVHRGENRRFFHEIQADENAHVNLIVGFLGAAARPKPTFQGLEASNYREFLAMSAAFENTGAGAYQGAAPHISDPNILATAAAIGFVEAFHSGFLNTLANTTVVPTGSSLAPALSQEEVVSRLLPYIASLNGGPAPWFSTTDKSMANDVAIVNFALVAEYLEQEFYNINIPRFYR